MAIPREQARNLRSPARIDPALPLKLDTHVTPQTTRMLTQTRAECVRRCCKLMDKRTILHADSLINTAQSIICGALTEENKMRMRAMAGAGRRRDQSPSPLLSLCPVYTALGVLIRLLIEWRALQPLTQRFNHAPAPVEEEEDEGEDAAAAAAAAVSAEMDVSDSDAVALSRCWRESVCASLRLPSSRESQYGAAQRYRSLRQLLDIISNSNESLCALWPPFILSACRRVLEGEEEGGMRDTINQQWGVLQRYRPQLSAVLEQFNVHRSHSHSHSLEHDQSAVLELFKMMMERAAAVHLDYETKQRLADEEMSKSGVQPCSDSSSDYDLFQTDWREDRRVLSGRVGGQFYGHRQRLRRSFAYTFDRKNAAKNRGDIADAATRQCTEEQNKERERERERAPGSMPAPSPSPSPAPAPAPASSSYRQCGKWIYPKPRLSGGILIFWCQHRICYGYHMIEVSEGLKEVMYAVQAYWQRAPSVMIYDNACNLMKCCHNREWGYWKDTTFLVDTFHKQGHTKCSQAHSIEPLREHAAFRPVQTSQAETGNKGLKKIKMSTAWMAAITAFIYILLQLEIQNCITAAQIDGGRGRQTENRQQAQEDKEAEADAIRMEQEQQRDTDNDEDEDEGEEEEEEVEQDEGDSAGDDDDDDGIVAVVSDDDDDNV